MKFLRLVLLFTSATSALFAATPHETDVLVYGGTAGGAMAAIQTARMGKTVVLLEPGQHLGGLTTGGLGATDAGHRYTVGGIAREFYRRVFDYYQNPAVWKSEARAAYLPRHALIATEALQLQWFFEPKVASLILDTMLKEAKVDVRLGTALDRTRGVTKSGAQITELVTTDGQRFRAKAFIDATYEGDLLAAAGANYIVGREPNSRYNETLNGVQLAPPERTAHVSPFRVAGDPKSGLLPRVRATHGVQGEGDDQTQAFNFRLCLTNEAANRTAITRPSTYDALNYEVILRHILGRPGIKLNQVYSLTPMPNQKTDTNNRVYFSTDFVGGSHPWAEASDAERVTLWQQHKDYQLGLLWFIANDPRIPETLRAEAAHWGLARDEFTASENWPPALYVREARRLISDYVLTEHDCTNERTAPDPVTLGSYAMDSHVVNYVVDAEGRLRVDGWVAKGSKPYGISYRTLLPKRAEVTNLLVTVCISSSHVAYGSLRMEPVFMNLGQAAATAAVLAIENKTTLHDLPYATLRTRLDTDGQIFDAPAAKRALEDARKKLTAVTK
ncbi:FAD-dependent oxidoreductase [Oleiharenicola lentus]|uniref:FAD-dependent oxidoreductase n=1 Tax=Oleiharenicola lentus TaxID=2508720 RepID=UPI003F673E1D